MFIDPIITQMPEEQFMDIRWDRRPEQERFDRELMRY